MELSVSSETTFFNMKLQLEICPQLRTGSSAEDMIKDMNDSFRVVVAIGLFELFRYCMSYLCVKGSRYLGIIYGPQLRTYFELQFHIEECRF